MSLIGGCGGRDSTYKVRPTPHISAMPCFITTCHWTSIIICSMASCRDITVCCYFRSTTTGTASWWVKLTVESWPTRRHRRLLLSARRTFYICTLSQWMDYPSSIYSTLSSRLRWRVRTTVLCACPSHRARRTGRSPASPRVWMLRTSELRICWDETLHRFRWSNNTIQHSSWA